MTRRPDAMLWVGHTLLWTGLALLLAIAFA